jgi:hypothetical protein
MSATKYQIFCRYFQASSSRAVTNETTVEWVQAEQTHEHTDTNNQQPAVTMDTKSIEGYENMYIRQEDWSCVMHQKGSSTSREEIEAARKRAAENKKTCQKIDTQLSGIVSKESRSSNPKYDMMFVYDGLTECLGADGAKSTKYGSGQPIPDPTDDRGPAHIYYERMKRIDGPAPWFEYATCASLTVAMRKAEELVNIMGKENVIIGKIVNLKEYIDIE